MSCLCSDDDPVKARQALIETSVVRVIHDESHFMVAIESCLFCRRLWLKVFAEEIDWSGGNDPQEVYWIPITEQESEHVVASDESIVTASTGKRVLWSNFAKDADAPTLRWVNGPVGIPPHD
ncbi:MAG TPA: hypothetical protein PLH94_07110 [Fimbriimonadaceae bacterium]|nr:hypothetical protein [Fimbriimonadaceae bacterium]